MTIFYFKLKGTRTYVHGTDIFASLINYVITKKETPVLHNLDFQIHKMIHTHLKVEEFSGYPIVKDNSFASTFSFREGNIKKIYILRKTGGEVTGRYEYDEKKIRKDAKLDKEKSVISYARPEGFSPIESVVAANKYLLQELWPNSRVKWLFGRLQVKCYDSTDNFNEFELVCERSLGHHLVKTGIHLRGKPWGKIFFSRNDISLIK